MVELSYIFCLVTFFVLSSHVVSNFFIYLLHFWSSHLLSPLFMVHTSIMFCLCDIADNAGVIVNPKGEMKGIVLKVLWFYMRCYNYSAVGIVENHP
jgi:hypothetical protein